MPNISPSAVRGFGSSVCSTDTDQPPFFFKQKTAYEIRPRDCSSDVCSSDLSSRKFSFLESGQDRLGPLGPAEERIEDFLTLRQAGSLPTLKQGLGNVGIIAAAQLRQSCLLDGDGILRFQQLTKLADVLLMLGCSAAQQ